MSLAPQPNPFEFTDDLPQKGTARTLRPVRDWRRLGAYLLGFVAVSIVIATMGRLVWLAHLDRAYRQPVVGRWAFDGPSRVREMTAFDSILAMMTAGFSRLGDMPKFYERPGWSLEMRNDGIVYEHGQRLGDWNARGKEGEWVIVQVWVGYVGYQVWKFRPEPDGKLSWIFVNRKPIPLRPIP